jgi:cystathionine beta-lyase/cystathionine gamma-synthase
LGQYVQYSSWVVSGGGWSVLDTAAHYIIGIVTLRQSTLAAHAGLTKSPCTATPHSEPIYQTSVFDFPTIEASLPALAGEAGYAYARNGLPNADTLAAAVAALEGGQAAIATSSGMGAIAALTVACCKAGDRVAVQGDAYGGTSALLVQDLSRFGVEAVWFDPCDLAGAAAVLAGARLALVESISNPLLRRPDLAALAQICRQHGCLLAVDNTFATPLGCAPLAAGADLVVHSVTKFLGGHHDLCAGALVGAADLVAAARAVAVRMGLLAAPLASWLAVRGLRTLAVRMERAWANAAQLAVHLAADSRVSAVYSADQCALVSFDLGQIERAEALVSGLSLITLSPSLGGVTTTISHPATSSHCALTDAQRRSAGIGPGLLRLSVGIEQVDDLWADLSRAMPRGS